MKKIFILGTAHTAPISDKLKDKISKEGIQVIIKEAVKHKDQVTAENFILEPFFMLFSLLWFFFPFSSKDAKSLFRLSKECNIDYFEDVDTTLTQLIKHMHTPVNYLISLVIIFIVTFLLGVSFALNKILIPPWLQILGGILLTSLLYSVLKIFKTQKFRDETMVANSLVRIDSKNYDRILFCCGNKHTKSISDLFKKKGFEVEELTGYQQSSLLAFSKYLP